MQSSSSIVFDAFAALTRATRRHIALRDTLMPVAEEAGSNELGATRLAALSSRNPPYYKADVPCRC